MLAVDIPSGVDGLTGQAGDGAVTATRTVTFAALKPGLLLSPGRQLAGRVTVADIGLDVSGARIHVVEAADLAGWLPERPPETHKWKSALWVVAGSPGMTGAAHLASRAAMRCGAGTVRLGIPGVAPDPRFLEVVGRPLPADGWDPMVVADSGRVKAIVVGPGLGRSDETAAAVRRLLAATPTVPVLVDADGLYALGHRRRGRGGDRRPHLDHRLHAPRGRVRPAVRLGGGPRPHRGGAPAGRVHGGDGAAQGVDHSGGRARRCGAGQRRRRLEVGDGRHR